MKKWKEYLPIVIVCILCLVPIMNISVYNRPSADDYDYAIATHMVVQNGGGILEILKAAWSTTISFYNVWQGLYTSAFLLSLQPGIFGAENYAWTAFIIMGIAYVCMCITMHVLNKHYIKKQKLFVFVAPLVIVTSLFLWLPSASEGIFWYNGAMNYMPFVFFDCVNMMILLEIYHSKSKTKNIPLVICGGVLSFLISGGNHVTAFANILLLLIATVYLMMKKRYYSIVPLLSAIVGFIIMYNAPGTAIRQSAFQKQGVVDTIIATIKHLRYIVGEWMSLPWIVSLILITPIALEIVVKNKDKFKSRFPFIELMLSVMVISGMFCVPYLPMGHFGAGRVTNVIWLAFMLLSWFNYVLIIGWAYKKEYIQIDNIVEQKAWNYKKVVLVIVSLLCTYFIQNDGLCSVSYEAQRELRNGIPQMYCSEIEARIDLYEDESLTEVVVKPFQVTSQLLPSEYIGTDPDVWPNTSVGQYYEKKIYIVYE